MKYYILHVFRASTPYKEKPFDHFKNLYKLKPLVNFDVNLTTSLLSGSLQLKLAVSFTWFGGKDLITQSGRTVINNYCSSVSSAT